MKVEHIPISAAKVHPKNMRAHDELNLQVIAKSLAEFGQQKPVVLGDDGYVLAGNGTVLAARSLGWKTIAVVRSTLKDEKALLYMIADNRATDLSDWDEDKLAAAFCEMHHLDDGALQASGFADLEIKGLIDGAVAGSMAAFARGAAADTLTDEEAAKLHRAEGDGNYLYVDWYGQDAEFQQVYDKLQALGAFQGGGGHLLRRDFFMEMLGRVPSTAPTPARRKHKFGGDQ